ncbi:MAG: hypothetical protein U1E36_02850 [Rickettsiales bacterium]
MNYSRIYEGAAGQPHHPPMEIKALSTEAVRTLIRETVVETLAGLGFDTLHPNEMQADVLYLRKLRHGSEEARRIVVRSVLTLVVTSMLYMLWEGIRKKL